MPFFWPLERPSFDISLMEWDSFTSEITALFVLIVVVAAVVLTALYAWWIRRFTIARPVDSFRKPAKAWWLAWILWALPAGVLMGLLYDLRFDVLGPVVNPAWGAITTGLFAWVGTVLLFQILILFPGVTPRKFVYHPWWFASRLFSARRSA